MNGVFLPSHKKSHVLKILEFLPLKWTHRNYLFGIERKVDFSHENYPQKVNLL